MEIVDGQGRRLARRRLAEGVEGIAGLHALIAGSAPGGWADLDAAEAAGQVKVGTGTDRGPWVQALIAAGYEVFAIGPMSASRYRERHPASGAKSDAGDAHVLAGIVRLDRAHHRPVAGDSGLAEAIKLVARSHQGLVWDRTRHILRLRSVLREFFPAALEAFAGLDAADSLELPGLAPGPDRAARLTTARITAALRRARRRQAGQKAVAIRAALRAPALRQPGQVQAALAAITASQVRLITALITEIASLGEVVAAHFGCHRDADIYTSQPGPGVILAARVLGEFGDDPHRFADAKARRNYAGTSPVTRASGTRTVVLARSARNQRLAGAAQQWASGSLKGSPGARAYYDELRARNVGHQAAIRQLANLCRPNTRSRSLTCCFGCRPDTLMVGWPGAARDHLPVHALDLWPGCPEQIATLQGQVEAHFGQHPDAEIITSQPGLGPVLAARVLAESGDDPSRYASARARKNYAGSSPITRASGKKKTVAARYVRNDRLIDALMAQAFTALHASPGARACYDHQRARGASHNAALRQLANRLTGILHGCLKTRTLYDEATAWPHTAVETEKPAA